MTDGNKIENILLSVLFSCVTFSRPTLCFLFCFRATFFVACTLLSVFFTCVMFLWPALAFCFVFVRHFSWPALCFLFSLRVSCFCGMHLLFVLFSCVMFLWPVLCFLFSLRASHFCGLHFAFCFVFARHVFLASYFFSYMSCFVAIKPVAAKARIKTGLNMQPRTIKFHKK